MNFFYSVMRVDLISSVCEMCEMFSDEMSPPSHLHLISTVRRRKCKTSKEQRMQPGKERALCYCSVSLEDLGKKVEHIKTNEGSQSF